MPNTKRETKRGQRKRGVRRSSSKTTETRSENEIEETVSKNFFLKFDVRQNYDIGEAHQDFIDLAKCPSSKVCIIDGPAGSGKTYFSVYSALEHLRAQNVEEIVYIRSVIESASKGLGFLPGEADEKFLVFLGPLFDKLQELLPITASKKLVENNVIRGVPVNYVRGSTFTDSCVIVDEAQNMTLKELKTVLTRVGENCRMYIIGDRSQSDIKNSGFKELYDMFNDHRAETKGIFTFKFTELEIVRSEILRFIIERFSDTNS